MKMLFKRIIVKKKNWGKVKLCKNSNVTITSQFEGHNYIGTNSSFDGYMGYASYIGDNSMISGKIGKYCCIASGVSIVNGFHPTSIISMHPAFYSKNNCVGLSYVNDNSFVEFRYLKSEENRYYDVIIESDVWIGHRVSILAGVRIGVGAVIGAGAIVTKDVEPYSIVAGNPAHIIRYRFEKDVREELLNSKWWEKGDDWIKKQKSYYTNVEELVCKMKEESL